MPEVLGDPPAPRTALFWNGAAWQWARVDALGHLQIDTLSTVMDPLAATAAAQALALAQLQLIAEMRDALQSVGTDRLIVRGEDQLFSFAGVHAVSASGGISGADGYFDSPAIGAGEVVKVTTVMAWDATNALTAMTFVARHDGVNADFHYEAKAFAVNEPTQWAGEVWLDSDDVIRVFYAGGQVGDTCHIRINGYIMTLEV